jgi:2-polyprenyl-3-methyl-5-hydroxy-6-metoxy-1,4-benzoquinol methylase
VTFSAEATAAGPRLAPRHRTVLAGCAGVRARRVLDVGCGDGSFTTLLGAWLGAAQLYGVELGAEAAAAAERNGLRTVQADLSWSALPFTAGAFDFIFAGEIIEHLVDTDGFCREMRRLLSPGGTLVVTTPNIAAWYNRLRQAPPA